MDAIFGELVKQAPNVGALLILVHVFLRFITEERKARDEKDASTLAAFEKLEAESDLRARECHRLQADAVNALHRVSGALERLPPHLKES